MDRPVAADIEIAVPKDNSDHVAIVRQCALQWGDDLFSLQGPAVIWRQAQGVHLEDWQWHGDPYRIFLTGDISTQHLALQARLSEIDLNQLPHLGDTDLQGRLHAWVRVTGSLQSPCIETEARIPQLTSPNPLVAAIPPLKAVLQGQLSQHHIQASLNLTSDQQDRIELHWHTPVRFSLRPWTWEVQDEAQALLAHLQVDLNHLQGFPVSQETLLSGRWVGQLQHTGPWRLDAPTGRIRWIDGSYEDLLLGTTVRNIQMECRIQDGRLIITQATAQSGQKGHIGAQGSLQLSTDEGLPYQLNITTQQFPWIQRPDVAVTASGDISLHGTSRRMTVDGQLKVDQGLVDLNALAPAPPPVLEQDTTIPQTTPSEAPSAFALAGDIHLDLGPALRVSGRGLESLWQGHLQFSRQTHAWAVRGEMTSFRGDYRLLGRPFRLERGIVRLDGSSPIDPILDIRTSYQRSGIQAMVDITGRASDPVLRISSEPAMPEDAVLAAVLFGKDLSTISSWQALQLANTLRNLQSPGQGVDLFQRTRQLAGIDYLDLQKQDNQSQDLSLAVGKYVQPNVYVEVQRPFNNQGVTTTRVEYEIQPNLTVEADVGAGIRPGLQINWKKDY